MFHKGDVKLAKELVQEYDTKRTALEHQYSMSKEGVPAMEIVRFTANEMAGCFLATYGFYAYSVFKQFPEEMKASYEANQPGTFKLLKRACKDLEFKIPELKVKKGQPIHPMEYQKWLIALNNFIGDHNKIEDTKGTN